MMPKGGRRAPGLEAELGTLSKCSLNINKPSAGLVLGRRTERAQG